MLVSHALSFGSEKKEKRFSEISACKMCIQNLRDSLVGDLTDGFEDLLDVDDADLEDYNLREYQSTIF